MDDRLEMERSLRSLRDTPGGAGRVNRVFEVVMDLDWPGAAQPEIRRIASLDDPADRAPSPSAPPM
jgi:hypothetical protein